MAATRTANRIEDAGEKIGGARKDWRDRFMAEGDLAAMTDEEAIAAVRKDSVWPQPDWEAAVAGGMPPEVAAGAKVIRDRMAQSPPAAARGVDPATSRAGFVRTVGMVRDLVMAARSRSDLEAVYGIMLERFGGSDGVRNGSPEDRSAWFSVYKGKYSPLTFDGSDARKAREMLDAGFPAKQPAWRKGLAAQRLANGTFTLYRNRRYVRDGFASEEAAFDWAKAAHEAARAAGRGSEGPSEWKRPHLDRVERTGMPDVRGGRDVSPQDFIDEFGFRAVEFGNWLPDGERQQVLNLAYDALHDLAGAAGWDAPMLSLGGRLAVAFGARGKGAAAAHYEAGRKVINMTRLSGAGSLAHEFAHALDHWAGDVGRDGPTASVRSGSGWYERTRRRTDALGNLPGEAASAWDGVAGRLFMRRRTHEEAVERYETLIVRVEKDLETTKAALATHLARREGKGNRAYVRECEKVIDDCALRLPLLRESLERVRAGDTAPLGEVATDLSKEARKLCGPSGEYWLRPTEMFARSFEAWVFDRVAAAGGRSDYLVHGVEEGRFAGEGYKGDPYPSGSDRIEIGAAMGALVDVMRPVAETALEAGPAPRA